MIKRYFRSERVRARLKQNYLSSKIEKLIYRLDDRGHPKTVIQLYVQAAEHFGNWLCDERRRGKLSFELVELFVHQHLPECTCPPPAPCYEHTNRAALRHLVRACGDDKIQSRTDDPREQLVLDYITYLREVAGLADATCLYRARYAREFLRDYCGKRSMKLDRLTPQKVIDFTKSYATRCKRSSAQVAAVSLRSFLSFLQTQGLCEERLVRAVPWIPNWKLSDIPRVMTEEQLRFFLKSFNRQTATGRRDFAIALCMTDLGLRASEIPTLQLHHIDWESGVIEIQSAKERRSRTLPLLQRVGKAIVAYLKSGRPKSKSRYLFLRHRTPIGEPVSIYLVRGVINRAHQRCDFTEWSGTHVLRHTAATRLHSKGASLKEVADFLGHRSIETSKIYCKVNLESLSAVALPWPKEV